MEASSPESSAMRGMTVTRVSPDDLRRATVAAQERGELAPSEIEVEIWICPVCHSYHGATSAHGIDLTVEPRKVRAQKDDPRVGGRTAEQATAEQLEQFGSRALCPYCLEQHPPQYTLRVKKVLVVRL